MSIIKFKVRGRSENETKLVVKARQFKIIVDEPQDLGGTDEGPNPMEYVLAAFSGCLNIVGHLIAKEMGFELRGLEIEVEGDLDPSKFMGHQTDERAGYKEIRIKIKPDTDASAEILEKWVEIVESRCPVSDNISNATPIKISLEEKR